MIRLRSMLWLALASLLACSAEQSDTKVIVEVLTDLPDQLAFVQVSVSSADGSTLGGESYRFEIGENPRSGFPVRFAVAPRDDDTTGFFITVTGSDRERTPRVTAKARSRFVPGKATRVSLLLLDECADTFCEDVGETCTFFVDQDDAGAAIGECGAIPELTEPIDLEEQRPSSGGSRGRDAGVEVTDAGADGRSEAGADAGVDSGARDAGQQSPAAEASVPPMSNAPVMEPAAPAGKPPADAGVPSTSVPDAGRDAGSPDAATRPADASVDAQVVARVDAGGGVDAGRASFSLAYQVRGSATRASCSVNAPAGAGLCGEYYCGTTGAAIAAEMSPTGACRDPEYACTGQPLTQALASASRVVSDVVADTDQAMIDAVRRELLGSGELAQHMSESCAECYAQLVLCEGDDCDEQFADCSGLPEPF
jgi:hypothetical protein